MTIFPVKWQVLIRLRAIYLIEAWIVTFRLQFVSCNLQLVMDIEIYRNQNGNEPFIEWLSAIRDKVTAARIRSRLRRIEETENLGDYRSVGGGVFEFRLQFGAGYRIYFGKIGEDAILLLRGGDKSSQSRDIERARTDWREHNSRELENE